MLSVTALMERVLRVVGEGSNCGMRGMWGSFELLRRGVDPWRRLCVFFLVFINDTCTCFYEIGNWKLFRNKIVLIVPTPWIRQGCYGSPSSKLAWNLGQENLSHTCHPIPTYNAQNLKKKNNQQARTTEMKQRAQDKENPTKQK
jgi:hypothetical protein